MEAPVTPAPKPPRWRRWALEIAIFLAIFIGIQAWQLRDAARGPAPNFSGQLLNGQLFDLNAWRATFPGEATLLYFWAEWCPVCKTTAGNVTAVSADWPVTTIAIQSGDAQAVSRWMQDKGYRWDTLADPASRIMQAFNLPGVPAFVIIGPDGQIRSVAMGYTSELGLRLRLWWASRA